MIPLMEKDNPAKKSEVPPPTFTSEIKKFQANYAKIFRRYPLDEDGDLLSQHCDSFRKKNIPVLLELAETRIDCLRLLNMTPERNTQLCAKIIAKMETLKPQQPKK
jgi:hypothetical protein